MITDPTVFVPYNADGHQVSFPYPFRIYDESDLLVIVTDTDGVNTTQTLNVDYTVDGVGEVGGGDVVFVTHPDAGFIVTVALNLSLTQETHYVEDSPFPAESTEDALDRLTMLISQLTERVPLVGIQSPIRGLTLPEPSAGASIGWDDTGTALENRTSGPQGPQGVQGTPGGPQGSQGNQGNQGPQGEYGGPQGTQGTQGVQGDQGTQGVQGLQGNQGQYGGPQGNQGSQGVQGTQGTQGNQGEPNGPQGYQGVQGSTGNQGPQGPQGTQGVQGAGSIGNQGNQGAQGTQGTPGNTGGQGNQGPQGPQGSYGGPQGNQGVQGNQGNQGEGNQGSQGNQGIKGDQGNQGNQGPTDGPQGDQGVQGNQGVPGATGNQGVAGNQGSQGPQGSEGTLFARNPTSQTTNYTGAQNIPGLTVYLAANSIYEFEVVLQTVLYYGLESGGGFGVAFSAAGATISAQMYLTGDTYSISPISLGTLINTLCSSDINGTVLIKGIIATGASVGYLTVQFASLASNIVKVNANSYIKAIKRS